MKQPAPEILSLLENGNAAQLRSVLRAGGLMNPMPNQRGALPRAAAYMGWLDVLKVLCEESHGTALEPDEQGRDVLHCAAQSGNLPLVRYAVEALGFDPLRGDCAGMTALDAAKQAGHAEVLGYLEKHVGFALDSSYRNPVRRGFYPDPSVVRVGEDYYMVNSTFVQFPALPISHSRDLVHWRTIGHAIDRLEWSGLAGLPGGHGYWAPDISWHNGRFWVVATLRRNSEPYRLQMITSAARPEGPYDQPRFLEINGIDPSLFTDDDGRRYLLVNPGARIVEINENGEMIGEPQTIYYGSARVKTEGSHLLKKDGWYYLFQAEGGTGPNHMETAARSRSLRGPYIPCPHNPILGKREENAPIRRSGHGKPVSTPDGRWYMMYLCGRDVDGATMLGRETALDPMTWTAEGWPMVNGLKGPSCLQRMPLPAVEQPDEIRWLDFISPRNEPAAFACCTDGIYHLRAGGDPAGTGPASLLLRRQTERGFVQSAGVDASALETGGFGGLAGYYDENSFYLFGIERDADGWVLTVQEQVGARRMRTVLRRLMGAKAVLCVQADGAQRRLLCDGEEAAVLDAAYLSDEGLRMGKRFTGAALGMAAVGAGGCAFSNYQECMKA